MTFLFILIRLERKTYDIMKISILTGSFYPSIHPRAFRANELAKEFVRQGHEVTVINLKTVPDFDYAKYSEEQHFKIINLGIFAESRLAKISAQKGTYTWWGQKKRFLIEYLLCGNLFRYGPRIAAKLNCLEGADMVIAQSTPFPCHYGFYKYIKRHGRSFVAILDSGDPFYYSKQTKRAIWFKYIERNVYRHCDFLTIPTANAIPLYSPLISKEKIRVIPQGFSMRNLKLYTGDFYLPVKFAYAGVFYWDIRNPEFLFRALENLSIDYKFYIYMRYKDARLDEVLEKYPKMREHLIINLCVPHDQLITELSKMHFLVNVENISNTQIPSKIIDYCMAGRPILSCNETNFDIDKLNRFLHGNYDGRYDVDPKEYDIENVAQRFLELYKQKNYSE